jgi:uncharacterized protein (TIGR03086 family)
MDDVAEITARYQRRADRFDALVAAVSPERWDGPSPCAEWTTRDVVGHIVDMHAAMLHPVGRSLSPAPSLQDDPLGAYRAARADVEALLADPEVAGSECQTPMGPQPVAGHIDGVVSQDLVLHGWDLARGAGLDDTFDPEELDRLWPGVNDIPDEMRIPGAFGPGVVVFGPEVEVAHDAPIQSRVLGKLGRDPNWAPAPLTA